MFASYFCITIEDKLSITIMMQYCEFQDIFIDFVLLIVA